MERDQIKNMTYCPISYTMWDLKCTKSDFKKVIFSKNNVVEDNISSLSNIV